MKRTRSAGRHWPLIVVALLAGGAGVNIALMVVATRDSSFAVEPDYYRKAVEWDQTMIQTARNATLGWSAAVTLERTPRPAEVRLIARVRDREGRDVAAARVGVQTFHSAHASRVLTATLAADPGGAYAATLPLDRPGLWEVRLRVERGDQVFTASVERDLGRAP